MRLSIKTRLNRKNQIVCFTLKKEKGSFFSETAPYVLICNSFANEPFKIPVSHFPNEIDLDLSGFD